MLDKKFVATSYGRKGKGFVYNQYYIENFYKIAIKHLRGYMSFNSLKKLFLSNDILISLLIL